MESFSPIDLTSLSSNSVAPIPKSSSRNLGWILLIILVIAGIVVIAIMNLNKPAKKSKHT